MDTNIVNDLRLKLHIQYPDLEECYVDGFACALAEIAEEANPYEEETIEHQHWQDGWWAGFYNEKPLFTLSGNHCDAEQPKPDEHHIVDFLVKFLEISGVIAVSALVSYQLWDMVA